MRRAQKRSLLDSSALYAFLNRERGLEKVNDLLRTARRAKEPLLMNEINIGEVYYLIARRQSLERAEHFLRHLQSLPIEPVSTSFADVLEAARLKARFPISYADAFVVATALRADAVVVTGDPEFHAVSELVEIQWL